MVLGPFATWEYISKISASIPVQRKIKDHVEAEFNHFRRGKSHTDPAKEADIRRLEQAYEAGKAHVYVQGRKLAQDHRAKDYIAAGSDPEKLQKTLTRWQSNRLSRRTTIEDHSPEPPVVDSNMS